MLPGYLAYQRSVLLRRCAGLTGEELARRAVPPSSLSLLGLLRHLAKVERRWFRERFAGEKLDAPYDPALGADADFDDIDPATILHRVEFEHPRFDLGALAAQARLPELAGRRRTAYAGAYHGNGFHEDGLASGVAAARAFGVQW